MQVCNESNDDSARLLLITPPPSADVSSSESDGSVVLIMVKSPPGWGGVRFVCPQRFIQRAIASELSRARAWAVVFVRAHATI
jgi:hypothetical protein